MPSVSILIPVYQERDFIRQCLDSVLNLLIPEGSSIEVLVIDGMSTDGTRELIADNYAGDPRIHVIDNPSRYQSAGLNKALDVATGEYIMRLDAHSHYPRNYLVLCLETALRSGADNTGGIVTTLKRGTRYQAALVQALITHRFGVGNSGFRTHAPEGPADTVPYGFFRKEIFDKVGKFDERLIRAQDYEMNRRIIHGGGTVWRNPKIDIAYYPQPDFRSFIRKQFLLEAPYNAYMWHVAPYSFAARHAITALFATGVIGGLLLSPFFPFVRKFFLTVMVLYFTLAIISAVQQAVRYREPRHVLFLPLSFFLYHFLHGLGVIGGLLKLATGTAPVQKAA